MLRAALKCVLGMATIVGALGFAQSAPAEGSTQSDNTTVNRRDRNTSEVTADQQKESTSDRETTRHIRQAIVKDESLSTYAHNVKIISRNGVVTLKGPVNSKKEKRAIENKAAEIAGETNVRSELQVTAPSGK